MNSPVLLLLGDFSDRRDVIDRAAGEFGWTTVTARTYDEALLLCERAQVVGLLFHARERRQQGSGSQVHRPWSGGCPVRPIACLRPADCVAQHELDQLSAYHAILEPVSYSELRLSLGFLAQAVNRDTPQRKAPPKPSMAAKPRQEEKELSSAGAAA